MLIHKNVPLADKNWFGTGGNARTYAEPSTVDDWKEVLSFAKREGLPIFVLGTGANIIISDDGFDGLVIHPASSETTIVKRGETDAFVKAAAGVTMEHLINYCLDQCLRGFEVFAGIPSTVGGAAYINLHYFDSRLSDFLVKATVLEKASRQLLTVNRDWFSYGYNTSTLQKREHVLIDATFKLTPCTELEAAYAKGQRDATIEHRVRRYPSVGTCGSFFRNFSKEEVAHEKSGAKLPYVAYYLDKLGVKGALSVGDAHVSWQHANMLVNGGSATTSDIITLARSMQTRVHETYGILPQPECELVGFKKYPLLKRPN